VLGTLLDLASTVSGGSGMREGRPGKREWEVVRGL
jgi:hypothetical protein